MALDIEKAIDKQTHTPLSLLLSKPEFWVFIAALLACIALSILTDTFATPQNLFNVTRNFAFVAIIALALVGSYAIDMVIENVILSAVFGVIGYLMIRFDYPRITLVVALVLAALAERNYHQSMQMGDESWSIFFTRVPSVVLVVCVLFSIASPFIRAYWSKPAAAGATSG